MARLTALVLGSAAGGGVPQWNCRCRICTAARDGRVRPRTQTALAVTADGIHWLLLNAPPDLRGQILATPQLSPRPDAGPRSSPIAAVALTGAEIDQMAGLLHLREGHRFDLHGTGDVLAALAANPMFAVLPADRVARHTLPAAGRVAGPGRLTIESFPVPGKIPLYREDDTTETAAAVTGLIVEADGCRLAFVPEIAAVTPAVRETLATADVVLLDGTVFTDDELIAAGAGHKTGRRMGHVPIDGPGGSLQALDGLPGRRIFIHLNNTNPVLLEDSAERRTVERAGWKVAHDGMEIVP